MWSLETLSKEQVVLMETENPRLAESLEYEEVLKIDKEGNLTVTKVY